jgi:16S rRNA (guanine966-N2)-methyltransferase
LGAPAGRDTRPSSDRVKEGLFSALEARVDLVGARFVDLYAGSGAIGLEALSRGAVRVLLVESDQRAARVVRENIAALGVQSEARLVVDRVERALARGPAQPYDVVFADPPYAVADADIAMVLAALVEGGWVAEQGMVVVERSARGAEPQWVPGITPDGVRRYGETALWYGRRS